VYGTKRKDKGKGERQEVNRRHPRLCVLFEEEQKITKAQEMMKDKNENAPACVCCSQKNTKRGTRCRARKGKPQLVCGVCTGVVPSATMQSKDGKYVIIGGNGDSVYSRLMAAVGRPDMSSANPLYATNTHRCQRADEIYKV